MVNGALEAHSPQALVRSESLRLRGKDMLPMLRICLKPNRLSGVEKQRCFSLSDSTSTRAVNNLHVTCYSLSRRLADPVVGIEGEQQCSKVRNWINAWSKYSSLLYDRAFPAIEDSSRFILCLSNCIVRYNRVKSSKISVFSLSKVFYNHTSYIFSYFRIFLQLIHRSRNESNI